MLILRPVPALILGESKEETLQPNLQVTNFAAWFSGLLADAPSAYTDIDSYLNPPSITELEGRVPPIARVSLHNMS
jgi:hypothetical protein